MSGQLRIPRVVITPFFSFPFEASCVVVLSISQLFVPHFAMSAFACILLNSLDFWSSKTITSILLLSVVLLKAIHAMTFRTKFLLVYFDLRPPK